MRFNEKLMTLDLSYVPRRETWLHSNGADPCQPGASPGCRYNAFGSFRHPGTIRALATYLKYNSSLTHLNLAHNGIRADEVGALSVGLQKNHTLRGLHVEGAESQPLGRERCWGFQCSLAAQCGSCTRR